MSEQSSHSLENVYVARTVKTPQPEFEKFLGGIARGFDLKASVKNIASTHVTLLEPCGIDERFRSIDTSVHETNEFLKKLRHKLRLAGHYRHYTFVPVDPESPFRWVGNVDLDCKPKLDINGEEIKPYKLAVGLTLIQQLVDQRGVIEDCLADEFGELPKMRPLNPHTTVARIVTPHREDFYDTDPMSLLPKSVDLPSGITLNGLSGYFKLACEQ